MDEFFTDDIFIQEAAQLMDPVNRKQKRKAKDPEADIVKNIVTKAKSKPKESEPKKEELAITLSEGEAAEITGKPADIKDKDVGIKDIIVIEEADLLKSDSLKEKSILSGEFYSDDLLFASSLMPLKEEIPLTPEELKEKKFNELFCEDTYRRRIIKKIFKKDGKLFKDTVMKIFDCISWQEAAEIIDKLFEKNRVNYYTEDAVRFVDMIESIFTEDNTGSVPQSSERS